MLKIGVIGIGDIAKKAYLPVYSHKEGVEFHFFTRNLSTQSLIQNKYNFNNVHDSLESLIRSGIEAAFVHSSTDSHEEMVKVLLLNHIHVYVDKPITFHYETTKQLIQLAKDNSLIFTAGFNRRFAPSYKQLKYLSNPNMIIMQKNRKSLSDEIRRFVFDDFIHVIDTMVYLFPTTIENIIVTGKKVESQLHHVIVQFTSKDCTAIGIMNRDSGTIEEKLEIMSPNEKFEVHNVSDLYNQKDKDKTKLGSSDWEPTLMKRGFEQIVTNFIEAVQLKNNVGISVNDLLLTHQICEEVVHKLEKMK
ncbi:Gfo/Idh/MocA family protein [Heyndrickxia sporothermodurans]